MRQPGAALLAAGAPLPPIITLLPEHLVGHLGQQYGSALLVCTHRQQLASCTLHQCRLFRAGTAAAAAGHTPPWGRAPVSLAQVFTPWRDSIVRTLGWGKQASRGSRLLAAALAAVDVNILGRRCYAGTRAKVGAEPN